MTESDSDDESGREMSKNSKDSTQISQSQPPLTALPQEMAEVLFCCMSMTQWYFIVLVIVITVFFSGVETRNIFSNYIVYR